jgi:hypothetical protein
VEAPPFAQREPFTREAVHKLEREKRREIICEKDCSTRSKATTSGGGRRGPTKTILEEKEDTVGSVITMINDAILSTMMG